MAGANSRCYKFTGAYAVPVDLQQLLSVILLVGAFILSSDANLYQSAVAVHYSQGRDFDN